MYTKEDQKHHDKYNDLCESVGSLEEDYYHEEDRPTPDKSADFMTIPA